MVQRTPMPTNVPDLWLLFPTGILLLGIASLRDLAIQRTARNPADGNSPPSTAAASTESQSSTSR